jgi:exopolysaccharide biosynthesis protein
LLTRYLMAFILILLPACNLQSIPPNPILSAVSTPTPTSVASNMGTTDWQTLADGLEQRIYIPNNAELAQMVVFRIDPQQYRFRAIYRAENPLSITDWARTEPDAIAIINANFFDPENTVLGLLVSDGVVYGQSYQNRGGTFTVQNGIASVRSNRSQPYQGDQLEQAVQAFPLLVENGQQAYFNTASSRLSRRTIIGQDTDGNILVMVTPFLGLSLVDLSAYLPTTDLNIVNAFNLDGGGSTMMTVPSINFTLRSFDRVPSVLAVYLR